MSAPVEISHFCTEADIFALWCEGCFERFPQTYDANGNTTYAAQLAVEAHEATCVAYRDRIISEKLAQQARDDGRDDEADELLEAWL